MNYPVTERLAILLKQNYYNEVSEKDYRHITYRDALTGKAVTVMAPFVTYPAPKDSNGDFGLSAPYLMDVIMWLHLKHGIWIEVVKYKDHAADVNDEYTYKSNFTGSKEFSGPEQAYEAAIEYVINNNLLKPFEREQS